MGFETSSLEIQDQVRFVMELPVEFFQGDDPSPKAGVGNDIDQRGLLLYSVKEIPIGAEIEMVVFFPNGYRLDKFQTRGIVLSKEALSGTDWKGYRYRLRFSAFNKENWSKFQQFMTGRSREAFC